MIFPTWLRGRSISGKGGYITGIIGILIFPWKLIADPEGYIFTWLVGYSSLLGPIGGIMIADYFFIRRQKLYVNDLYMKKGAYTYNNGFNVIAIIALIAGILPNVPGFFITIGAIDKAAFWSWVGDLYNYAWFVGFFISGASYLLLMRSKRASLLSPTHPLTEGKTYVTTH
jgi:NCS1 family nucleobase:cation symporter-1